MDVPSRSLFALPHAATLALPAACGTFALPDQYTIRSLAADHYAQTMGYFCKKEWKFELATGIPLRIRLGSLEQCNHLEGKD